MKVIGRLFMNTIIFFVIGLFIIAVGTTIYKEILNNRTVIKADIIEVKASNLTLSYSVNDREYSDVVTTLPFAKYNKGDNIEVYYNNNPSEVNIKDSLAAMAAIPVCVCLTILFFETIYKVDLEEDTVEVLQK